MEECRERKFHEKRSDKNRRIKQARKRAHQREVANKKAKEIQHEIALLRDPKLEAKELYEKRRRGLSASELKPDALVLQREDRTKKWNDIKTKVDKGHSSE